MSPLTSRRSLLVLAGSALVLVACGSTRVVSVGAPDRPVGSSTPAPWPTATVAWQACASSDLYDVDGWECGTVDVPLDYDAPDGETIALAITRQPAADAAGRIGSLFVNPGGPGASEAAHNLRDVLPREVSDRFDLVGFDPRGVGQSTPVTCLTDEGKDAEADLNWYPADETEADELIGVLAGEAEVCAREQGDLLPQLGTMNGARDLDVLRAAVGDEKLTYLGFSYGTSLGATYADLFPANVRALVLDGPIDPTAGSGVLTAGTPGTIGGSGGNGVGYSEQDFAGAFDRFAAACRKETTCALEGDAGAALDDIRADVAKRPVDAAAVEAEDGRRLTAGLLEAGVASALYDPASWPFLAVGLQDARDGDGSVLIRMADEFNGRSDDGTWDDSMDAFRAVSCADFSSRPSEDEARKAFLGQSEPDADVLLECLGWPASAEPLRSVAAADTAPILVIGTVGDPATPYENAAAMAKALGRGVVLTWEGEGHTAFGGQSDCVDDAVTRYLVDGVGPAEGTRCPAEAGGTSSSSTVGDGTGARYELDREQLGAALAEGIEASGWSATVAECVAHKATTDMTDAELVRFWYTTDTYEQEEAVFKACGSSYDGA